MQGKFEDFLVNRNDDIDNAAFELIRALNGNDQIEWDMYHIGETIDAVKEVLHEHELSVCHPYYGDCDTPCYQLHGKEQGCDCENCLFRS